MAKQFKEAKSWVEKFTDFVHLLRNFGEALILVVLVAFGVWQYLKGLDIFHIILLLVALFGLLLVGLSYLWEWRKNRSTRYIPGLLSKMDEKMKWLIEVSPQPPQEQLERFIADAGEMLSLDIVAFKKAYELKDLATMKSIMKDGVDKAVPLQSFKEVLDYLTSIKGLMNFDNIGLESIKDKEFRKLEAHLNSLRKRVQDSKTVRRINTYLLWWEGASSYKLLGRRHYQDGLSPDLMPVKVKSMLPNIYQLIDLATSEYLGYVKDGIYGNN